MPDRPFTLTTLSLLGTMFGAEVKSAILPTRDGEVRAAAEKGEVSIAIAGGFLRVGESGAKILSDFAAEAESIEVARVEEAKRRAEELLRDKAERELKLLEIQKPRDTLTA
jgi:F0F1-type ATP synthase epsilon subunit